MAKSNGKSQRTYSMYRDYGFKEKDPVIDECRTAWQDSGITSYNEITDSGLSAATPKAWFEGKTRRPQFCSIESFMRRLGYTHQWVRWNGKSVGDEKVSKKKR